MLFFIKIVFPHLLTVLQNHTTSCVNDLEKIWGFSLLVYMIGAIYCQNCSESGKSTKPGTIVLWTTLIILKGGAKNKKVLLSNCC